MVEKRSHPGQSPVGSWEELAPAIAGNARPESTVVRKWVELSEEDSETPPLTEESEVRSPRPILLYKDERVIGEMRSRVVAVALRNDGVLEELAGWVSGRESRSVELPVDSLAGVDELILRSVVQRALPGDLGVECELKWQLGNDSDIDHITLMLLTAIQPVCVADFVAKVSSQAPDTPAEELILPGMPVCVFGTVTRKPHITHDVLALRDSRRVVRVLLEKENPLEKLARYLYHRRLSVLGIVHRMENLRSIEIRAGAVLAGDTVDGQHQQK